MRGDEEKSQELGHRVEGCFVDFISQGGTSLPIGDDVPSVTKADFVGRAKTCVARWFDYSGHQTARLRLELLRGVEAIARELPKRADWFEVITVALDGGGGLPIRIDGQRHRAFPCADCLVVLSVVPGWGSAGVRYSRTRTYTTSCAGSFATLDSTYIGQISRARL